MKCPRLHTTLALCLLLCSSTGFAQERGYWRAVSTTAKGITGDISFTGERIAINFNSFILAQIRTLTPAEIQAAFPSADNTVGAGNLYRTDIPAAKQFLHHNTLCGSEPTEWVVTYTVGKDLQVAFFSGLKIPTLTPEALADSTSLCGTYTYVR